MAIVAINGWNRLAIGSEKFQAPNLHGRKKDRPDGIVTIAVARRASSLTSLRGGDDPVILYDCDATVPEQVERLFHKIQSDYGLLCITVFNAGAFERREVVETDPADFERCWRIGRFAGFLVGRAAARIMLKQGQGTILFAGATASLRGSAGFVNWLPPNSPCAPSPKAWRASSTS